MRLADTVRRDIAELIAGLKIREARMLGELEEIRDGKLANPSPNPSPDPNPNPKPR